MSRILLPRFVVIKSKHNGKYLTRISTEESSEKKVAPTFLNSQGEDITSPLVKFELERAKKNPEYVHIRSCHNNKYLSVETDSSWIIASAEQPVEEDEDGGRKVTMFKPIKTGEEYFRFQHAGSQRYASLWTTASVQGLRAGLPSPDDDDYDVFKVLDWESLVIFPKTTVAFMQRDVENRYLSSYWSEGHLYLSVLREANIEDETVAHEIFTVGDGCVRIKNLSTGKFWRRNHDNINYIMPDSDDTTSSNMDTLFCPIKVGDNVVALRNLGNNLFCRRDSLYALAPSIVEQTKFKLVEPVMSRSIYGISFRKDDGRVYNLNEVCMNKEAVDNRDQVENTISFKFSYMRKSSSTFHNSVSFNLGVQTTLQVDEIPVILEGKIKMSADVPGTIEWAKTKAEETLAKAIFTTKVPPMTKAVVTFEATQATCDVPFSYIQRDTLFTGDTTLNYMEDGMYTGVNMFNIQIYTRHEKLLEDKK